MKNAYHLSRVSSPTPSEHDLEGANLPALVSAHLELTKSWYKANAQSILVERICAKISPDPRDQISVQRSQGEKKDFSEPPTFLS